MKPRRRVAASLSSALVVVLVALAWVVFAPPQLGGQTSYVIINGNSMEPGMHRGDLAVVRKSDTYAVGDVVTYRHPQIGPVIHRIIAQDGGRFAFKGDHNDFVDSYHPVQSELIGKLWFHVPSVGSWLVRFRSPYYMAGLLFVAFVGIGGVSAIRGPKPTGRAGRPTPAPAGNARGDTPMNQLLRNWQDTLTVLAAAIIALGGLAWVAFNRPTHHLAPANVPYSQSGAFAYSAAASDGRVYDTGAAASGEPVYRRLSDQVAFSFDYRLEAVAAANIHGTYHLVAELGDRNGWRRTIDLSAETPFSGPGFRAEGLLNLVDAQNLIAILEQQSGVKNDHYSLVVRPQVVVSGTVGGTSLNEMFSPALPMALDAIQLRMDGPANDADPLKPTASGMISTPVSKTSTIQLLALALPVSLARAVSVGGLGLLLATAGCLLTAAVRGRSPRRALPGRSPLVSVRGSVPATRTRIIDIVSLEDLAQIASRLGGVVLQEARPGYHAYFVHDGDLTYRFEAFGSAAAATAAKRSA